MHQAWWRHQMETFSALLALCAGNSPVPVNSPHNGQWRGVLMFSLICAWINGWVNNREAGDLRRYRSHYDVIVMDSTGLYPHDAYCARPSATNTMALSFDYSVSRPILCNIYDAVRPLNKPCLREVRRSALQWAIILGQSCDDSPISSETTATTMWKYIVWVISKGKCSQARQKKCCTYTGISGRIPPAASSCCLVTLFILTHCDLVTHTCIGELRLLFVQIMAWRRTGYQPFPKL